MRKLGLGLTVIGLTAPSFLQAVGLGEISVDSYLNQPLVAEIQLVSTAPAEVGGLQVKIAPDKIFQQIGIQRTGLHSQLEFDPVIKNGVPVIRISSSRPVTEPFLNFVIEVAWPKGKLLREYTVLLDPPVFRQQQAPVVTAPAAVEAAPKAAEEPADVVEPTQPQTESVQNTVTTESAVKQTETVSPVLSEVPPPIDNLDDIPLAETFPVTETMPVDKAATTETSTPEVAEVKDESSIVSSQDYGYQGVSEYEVQSGDTLWKIADSQRTQDVSVNQMMISLLRENPRAFIDNNINLLKRGYIMRVPEQETVASISNAEARAEVKKQKTLWAQYKERLAGAAVLQQPAIDNVVDTPAAESEVETTVEVAEPAVTDEVTEQAVKSDSELEIIVPDTAEDGSQSDAMMLADAGKSAELEKAVTLAREEVLSRSQENEELRSRVNELEALLTDKDRLINLKDEQLLDIQQKLGEVEEAAQVPAAVVPEPEPVVEEPVAEVPPEPAAETAAPAVEPAAVTPEPVIEEQTETIPEPIVETPQMVESTELMPRIPIDDPVEVVAEEAEPIEEVVAAVEEPSTPAQEAPAPVQTAATETTPESKSGFFKDLLSNPNLLMGTGFGALLLAGLGWLVARRKNTEEPAIPNITKAPTLEAFTQDDDFIDQPANTIDDEIQEIEGMLDIASPKEDVSETLVDQADDTELDTPVKGENAEELNSFIDTAFNIRTDELPDEAVSTAMDNESLDMQTAMDNIEETGLEDFLPEDKDEQPEETLLESADPDLEVDSGLDLETELEAETELDPATEAVAQADSHNTDDLPESDEVLAEADVYLAYGLNEQAIDLLKPALLDHPERHDYRGKLLEALYAMEDGKGYAEEAGNLKSNLAESAAGSALWGRVVAMGKDLAPDNELFSANDSIQSPPLEEITSKKPDAIDIDLGSDDFLNSDLNEDELKETIIRGEGTAEFDVNDNEQAYQDTQSIDPEDMAFALEDFDIPDAESAADSAETLMMDGATLHGLELTSIGMDDNSGSDATNEFQFDVSALDELDDAELGGDDTSLETDDGNTSIEEEFLVDPDTTQIDLKGSRLDASIEMTQVLDSGKPLTSETEVTNLDIAKETLAMNVLDEGEGEVSLLTGEDEIDTKLDLAKAYIDMGDAEGAKDALDEVINTGTDEQRVEAEKLLQQLA